MRVISLVFFCCGVKRRTIKQMDSGIDRLRIGFARYSVVGSATGGAPRASNFRFPRTAIVRM